MPVLTEYNRLQGKSDPGTTDVSVTFEWDEDKAKLNLKKHRVSFDEGSTVLTDPFSITIPDPDHSVDEPRHIDIGMSATGRILVVVYVERRDTVRIISCRKATPVERRQYEEGCAQDNQR